MFIGSNVSGFYNLKMSRSGVYSCLPVNRAGVGETATVNLTVVGKLLYCTSNLSWGGGGYSLQGGGVSPKSL